MGRPTRRDLLALGGGLAAGALVGGLARRATSPPRPRLRPPGAGAEARFLAACIRCGQCVEACPFDVLHLLDLDAGRQAGTPAFEARTNPCNFCQGHDRLHCIAVCPTDALVPLDDPRDARMGLAAVLEDLCLAHQGTICRACWHACPFPDEAIRLGPLLRPEVIDEACTGCGLCEYACPTEEAAIVVRPGQGGGARGG